MRNNPPTDGISRVFDLLPFISEKYNREIVFGFRQNAAWKTVSTEEYIRKSDLVSYVLLSLGIRKGDRIITITHNRPEFNFIDMGVLQIGAVHVPLYTGLSEKKLIDILKETQCKLVFHTNNSIRTIIQSHRDLLTDLLQIISIDAGSEGVSFDDFLETGKKHANRDLLDEAKASVEPADVASITYISGATTSLKGVELSHRNQVFNILAYARASHFEEVSNAVSLLPMAHSYERTINYCLQYAGVAVWYNEKIPAMLRDFHEVKPEMTTMVPLLIERLFAGFEERYRRNGNLKGKVKERLISSLKQIQPNGKYSFTQKLTIRLARRLILPEWKQVLGGRFRFILCGGAALDPALLNLSYAIGIPIYEGYGITEAGPLISYNTSRNFSPYSVGKPMAGVEVTVASDGEVLVKSPGVMSGYLGKPEETSRAFDNDGWLHTGDFGRVDRNGFLTLTGIKKDIFKLSSGLYVDPAHIERMLLTSPYIRHAWVYGHNHDYLIAIVVAEMEIILQEHPELKEQSPAEIQDSQALQPILAGEIKKYNSVSRGPDQISKFLAVTDEWSQQNGLLRADGQPARQALLENYRSAIRTLYKS